MTGDRELPAGDFASWVTEMQTAIRGERDSDVPCDGCTACCTSSQFVHIEPDETATLARIPAELLFPAPRLTRGHVIMGYDERGHCPMLVDDTCSIYEDRPRACRIYDCRIFAATELPIDGDEKQLIAERVARWRFTHPTQADRDRHDAVRAATRDLQARGERNPTEIAVRAIETHEEFLR